MNDMLKKDELEQILSVLGAEGVLDTLLCVQEMEWATASEIAERMDTHVATSVKRLSGLYDIGILDRRVRKGRTRSAQEYSLISSSFGLEIDLDEFGGDDRASWANIYLSLLTDMGMRISKFSGRTMDEIYDKWGLAGLEEASESEVLDAISIILDNEVEEYGLLTIKSLAAASLDAVGFEGYGLPKKYFEVKE